MRKLDFEKILKNIIIYYNTRYIIILIFFTFLFYFGKKQLNKDINENSRNKLIEDNFFIIDSNNLEGVESHMYGFSVSKEGIITDNYYKKIGYYEEPEYTGAFVMIRTMENEIKIHQDFHGSFGLYIYENKKNNYYALSNSFLLLEEYLVGKQNISLNKEFSDNLILSYLCTTSIFETLIKEIISLPSNSFIIINKKNKSFKVSYIDYKENTIPLESEEGLKIIDKWVDKWSFILRSIKVKTNNIISDLSGGFDTRSLLSILLNSGIEINKLNFNSAKGKLHGHDEDFKIASDISSKYEFKLNKLNLDQNAIKWSAKDILFCSMYTKLGFHKEFYLRKKFHIKPRFIFTGDGGEYLRGKPGIPIEEYIIKLSSKGKKIIGHKEDFFNSSLNLCQRSVSLLKKEKNYYSECEISLDYYVRYHSNHFGKKVIEGFIANSYFIQPLIDPDIRRIKYNVNNGSTHDLIAYLYVRFAHDLIYFPIQGNRTLNQESIKRAEKLNKILPSYRLKYDFNKQFYIDKERISSVHPSKYNESAEEILVNLFESKQFFNLINKIYDKNVYDWAKQFSKRTKFFPLRHIYALLAIAITIECISVNDIYFKKFSDKNNNFPEKISIIKKLLNINNFLLRI